MKPRATITRIQIESTRNANMSCKQMAASARMRLTSLACDREVRQFYVGIGRREKETRRQQDRDRETDRDLEKDRERKADRAGRRNRERQTAP